MSINPYLDIAGKVEPVKQPCRVYNQKKPERFQRSWIKEDKKLDFRKILEECLKKENEKQSLK